MPRHECLASQGHGTMSERRTRRSLAYCNQRLSSVRMFLDVQLNTELPQHSGPWYEMARDGNGEVDKESSDPVSMTVSSWQHWYLKSGGSD